LKTVLAPIEGRLAYAQVTTILRACGSRPRTPSLGPVTKLPRVPMND